MRERIAVAEIDAAARNAERNPMRLVLAFVHERRAEAGRRIGSPMWREDDVAAPGPSATMSALTSPCRTLRASSPATFATPRSESKAAFIGIKIPVFSLQGRQAKLRSRSVPLKGRLCRNDGAQSPDTQSTIGA